VPADDPTLRLVRGWITYDGGNRDHRIFAMDPANPDSAPLVLNVDGGDPIAWSTDGTKLLIRGNYGLFVQNADGTPTYLFGLARSAMFGSFSPDGSQVIFLRSFGDDREGIYVQDADGGGLPQLLYRFPDPVNVVGTSVGVSPDGSQIAYFEQENDASVWAATASSLWVMNADGTDRHQIIGAKDLVEGWPGHLEWSPDGTRLTFEMDQSIYVVNSDGSGLALVANRATGRDAYWSPDGTRIAFTRRGPNARHLAIVRADGTELREFDTARAGPWNPLDP
jgi:Tol biopolymer transport system component